MDNMSRLPCTIYPCTQRLTGMETNSPRLCLIVQLGNLAIQQILDFALIVSNNAHFALLANFMRCSDFWFLSPIFAQVVVVVVVVVIALFISHFASQRRLALDFMLSSFFYFFSLGFSLFIYFVVVVVVCCPFGGVNAPIVASVAKCISQIQIII